MKMKRRPPPDDHDAAMQAKIRAWAKDPLLFVQEALKVPANPGITTQQREGLEALRVLMLPRLKRLFARDSGLPCHLTADETLMANKFGLSIMSGQGTGKDTFCAWAVLWFLMCMKNAKILCTAPTAHQLKTVLWSEIAKWLKGSLIEDFLTHQSNVLYMTDQGGKMWFASWRTISTGSSPDEQATVLAGQHEDRMMFVVDEAAAVPDPVYKPIEGAMTSLCNVAIVIFNPTLTTGYALKTQNEDRANWVCLRWNAEDSELLAGTGHCERMEKKYGRDSAPYRIRVLGLPPYADSSTLIPHDWVQRAVDREVIIEDDDVPLAGLDVSGGGKDGNVFCYGQGYRIFPLERKPTLRSKEIVEWAHNLMYQYDIEAIAVDSNAIGASVAEGLQDLGHYVIFCNVGRIPVFSDKESVQTFQRLRDEIWWMMREVFEYDKISIPNDQSLIDQLPIVKYKGYEGLSSQVKIESKREMIARGVSSPDEADALGLYLYAKRLLGKRRSQDFTDERRRVPYMAV